MKIKDFVKVLNNMPQDMNIRFSFEQKISNEILKNMSYPYPYEYKSIEYDDCDVGYSENEVVIQFIEKDRN